jgi:pimeloyl-ACP methyl ester carboxylesterase
VKEFRVDVPEAVLVDLRDRLHRTRWPSPLEGAGWSLGTDADYLRELCGYWAERFDWREAEAAINEWPQVITTIDGQRVHALHARSTVPGALPIILTHGWPGSVFEFVDLIGPLVDPVAHGGEAEDAFHVVCPSLPGYGWSGPTTQPGWDVARIGAAWAHLMEQLGYERYGAQGGDWGSAVTAHLAAAAPEHVVGIHLNLLMVPFPTAEDETRAATSGSSFYLRPETESGYSVLQGTRPQTLSFALTDSPAGQAAWIVEKFRAWSDCDGDVESRFSRDLLLANITTYWVTGTAGSSARLYFETRASGRRTPAGRVGVPTGVAAFPKELFRSPRWYGERFFDIVRWTDMPRGGHFAALEEPGLLVQDIREFFRTLR